MNGVESDLDGVPLRWIETHTTLFNPALNPAPRGHPLSTQGPQINNAAETREDHRDPGSLSRRMVQFIIPSLRGWTRLPFQSAFENRVMISRPRTD